jgi:hypothetical protein
MKIEFRSQESVIFILGGGDSAMTPVLKIGVRSQKRAITIAFFLPLPTTNPLAGDFGGGMCCEQF